MSTQMKGFFIYTDKGLDKLAIDVNFNFWHMCGWEKDNTYLDIGVKVHDLTKSCCVNIMLPFRIEPDCFISLNEIVKDVDVISAIFNETYSVQERRDSEYIDVKNTDDHVEFEFFKINIEEVKDALTANPDVLQIKLPREGRFKEEPIDVYFRFRLQLRDISPIVRTYDPPSKWIMGTFSKRFLLDFRYNDTRTLPRKRLAEIKRSSSIPYTKKIHFLLMTKAYVHVESGMKDIRSRKIEPELWNKYIGQPFDMEDIVAYHAKKVVNASEDTIRGWDFFAKETVENWNWHVFILITVIWGVLCNFVYDIIKCLYGNIYDVFICLWGKIFF